MSFLKVARELEPRQGRVVTQTITRPYTTIIATVTLGGDGYGSTSTPDPTSGAIPTDSTTSTSTLAPVTPTNSATLTPDQLGAILGSIFGTLFLVVFFWYYCVVVRRRRRRSYGESDSESSLDERERRARMERLYRYRAMFGPEMVTRPGPALVQPLPRIPPSRPTPAGYRQTSYPQFRGTYRYP
ncbi:hypothetical protein GQ53DRAFT_413868 [Thozetella sp. PMI_491]|nr:hypothetical protein GQ53DRAFT_413868 [Thozetella sp. PMI_491]